MIKYGIDWNQPSTLRGIVWFLAGVVSLLFLVFSTIDKAMAVIAIAGSISGGLGLALKDPYK